MEEVYLKKKLKHEIFKYLFFFVIFFSVSTSFFIWIGMKIQKKKDKKSDYQIITPIDIVKNKFIDVLQQVEKSYVNEIDIVKYTGLAIKNLISTIDQNSSYIDAKSIEENWALSSDNESLDFIYNIDKGQVFVVAPIYEGLSYDIGLRSGDEILKINDDDLSVKKYNELELATKFVASQNSKVSLLVKKKDKSLQSINFAKKKIIPTSNIISCMLEPDMGYIKINFFGQNSSKEFGISLSNMIRQGLKNLILDIRSNPGGDIDEAISTAEKLLKKGTLICAIKGKIESFNRLIYSKAKEIYDNINILVLIDEGTAGGAEILAGAIQDNDKGIIAGSKSFGKGFIKNKIILQDGSQILLTVGRYYTPSGRSISKENKKKNEDQSILVENLKNIDYISSENINSGENIYHTLSGRIVYGDGGIVPDFFIVKNQDTNNYLDSINFIIKEVAKSYTSQNINISKTEFNSFMKNFEVSNILVDQVIVGSKEAGIECDESIFKSIKPIIKIKLKCYIASLIWKSDPHFILLINNDETIQKAIKILKENSFKQESKKDEV